MMIDLHTHSRISDGSESPARVVALSKEAGLSAREAEMVGRIGGVAGVLLFGFLGAGRGLGLTILTFAGVALLGSLLTWLTLPETKPSSTSECEFAEVPV
jgi:hypothetical protein